MRLAAAVFACLLSASARAEETAAFLKIGVGARALGMGGAYTAIARDVNAIAWNPAGLSYLPNRGLGVTHAELTANTRYDFLGYAHPTQYGTFAAAGAYLSQGAIEGRDAQGRPIGKFQAADSAISMGYALKLSGGMRLGGNVKYIKSSIADVSAQSYALDFGSQYEIQGMRGPGVPMVGLAVQNLGPGMKFLDQSSVLPLTLVTGLGYRLPVGLIVALDFKHRPYGRSNEVNVGTEYGLFSNFALRAGYGSAGVVNAASGGALSAINGFAAGFGLNAFGYSLDYSMTPFGELGKVQRFSLGARF